MSLIATVLCAHQVLFGSLVPRRVLLLFQRQLHLLVHLFVFRFLLFHLELFAIAQIALALACLFHLELLEVLLVFVL